MKVVALSGGIGGAKLALGLMHALGPRELTVVANTADDFEHLGLLVCPDLDTLLYTLGGRADAERGWGRAGESWGCMAALAELGGPDWFQLGDRDLATHLLRTSRLRAGETLTAVMSDLAARFGIAATLLPMSDDPVRTRLKTAQGWMEFQPWFVGRRAEPAVTALDFAGAEAARPSDAVLAALADTELGAVVLCPSNPFISIDPMLAMPWLRAALHGCRAPVIAVSPIIAGQAVKGPTARMLAGFGLEVSATAVARHYGERLSGYVVDSQDAAAAAALAPLPVRATRTLMVSLDDRIALAREVLDMARSIGPRR
ncbi:2-phospho-L-lactate transferase [Falsiroseomonas oryzae]|uniref:2-phospho-L-lactate transferase n=1 Tax=Falsiroseomonas oryzae TaxID=2766473 RepID=UPI0022EAF0E1|nr:2-phospho-L-lactate transferase [Roseomonas sp. MO-31]